MRAAAALVALALALLVAPRGASALSAQEGADRARALVEAAVAALGGDRYLAVTSVVSTGIFTAFQQGRRGVPLDFVDTIVFPDRNRTEFGKKKSRMVQANAGARGWKYDASRQTLEAQNEDEVGAFQRYVRANVDNVLRQYWRAPGTKLSYVGREEVAPRRWAEVVAVEYEDGFRVELLFDPATHLPAATRYREGAESGAPGSLVESKYFVYLDYGGVKVPRTVDLYRDQVQTARIVYDDVKFNVATDASFFEQPESAKALKQ